MTLPDNHPRRRPIFLAFGFLGLLAMSIGAAMIIYVYALASMVDPALHGSAYWREVLKRMFFSGAVVPTLFGLLLAVGGAFAAISYAAVAVGLAAPATRRTWSALLAGLVAMLAIGAVILALS